MTACTKCGAPVTLAPDGDPKYMEPPQINKKVFVCSCGLEFFSAVGVEQCSANKHRWELFPSSGTGQPGAVTQEELDDCSGGASKRPGDGGGV